MENQFIMQLFGKIEEHNNFAKILKKNNYENILEKKLDYLLIHIFQQQKLNGY